MKIHPIYQPKRTKPFAACWYEGSRQRNRFFATKSSRADFIEGFQKLSERQDPTLHELAPQQLIRWQQASALSTIDAALAGEGAVEGLDMQLPIIRSHGRIHLPPMHKPSYDIYTE